MIVGINRVKILRQSHVYRLLQGNRYGLFCILRILRTVNTPTPCNVGGNLDQFALKFGFFLGQGLFSIGQSKLTYRKGKLLSKALYLLGKTNWKFLRH